MLIGVVVFGLEVLLTGTPLPPNAAEDPSHIIVTPEIVSEQTTNLSKTLGRAPSSAELQRVMEQWIQTEVLAREARAVGLDRNDAVVRNRLANKMTYVHRSIEVAPRPTDQQLRNLFESNSEDYRIETQLTLRQLYTGADESLARQLRESWLAGEDPRQLADQALTPPGGPVLRGRTPERLAELFGDSFSDSVLTLEDEPKVLASNRGWHVVRVESRRSERQLTFEQAKDRLAIRWQNEWIRTASDKATSDIIKRYRVTGWP